ncbi:MAG: M23 family metallopeptidase [Gemmatimonadetes bacterium]|nr:M23 family metallopeptidase [Gemmatimonadota bacterium]
MDSAARLEARRVARENEALTEQLVTIQDRVNTLEGSLGTISAMDSRLRLLAGLDSIDPELLQVGVGGPSTSGPESNPLWAVDSTLSKEAFVVGYDLNVLERRASLLRISLGEATDSLMAHVELLESMPSILPTSGIISSQFSKSRYHPIHQVPLPHEGVDIAAVSGTPIMAAAKGVITRSQWESGYGQMVEIDHGYGFTTRYGHASKLLVRVGQQVRRGDVIALVGNTGIATSSHLHYEVRVQSKPRNPLNYVIAGAIP